MSLNNYSKVLTFFLEHGVQLTNEQIEILKEELLYETRFISQDLDGYAHKYGVDTTSNAMIPLRKVDLFYRRYLNGRINEEEYESKVKEIESEYKEILNNKNIRPLFDDFSKIESRKEFTKSVGARQNKNHVEDFSGKLNFKGNNKKQSADLNNLTPEEYKKLERHINIAQSTNNEREYKDSHNRINKLIGKDEQNAIGLKNNNKTIISVAPGETIDNTTMYHTSKQNNINQLKGEHRSSGRMLYPDNRVYVSSEPMAKGGNKKKSTLKDKAIYQINPDQNNKPKVDNEFSDEDPNISAYLEKDKVKAKQIKRTGEDYNK